jgi:hypothetical protein
MGLLTDLFGGPGKTREFGGGFDPAVKPYLEEGLDALQAAYRQGPRVFEGERVVGFDPLQTQAQEGIVGLVGTTDPYTQRQQQLLEQGITGLQGVESRLSAAEQGLGRGASFLEDFTRGVGRAEESIGASRDLLSQFQTGLGRTEESLGRGLGFLEDFRSQAGEAQRRLEGVEPGLSRSEALLAESARRQREAARGVGLGELDIDKYRSDYMTAVADPALADVERQLQMDLRELGAQEAKYGQGRGSRGAILEAELRGAAGRSRADILGQVGKEAYQSALDTAKQQQAAQYGADVSDIDREARAAAALSGLGQAEQAAAIGGRGALAGMFGDVAGRSLAGAAQAGDITRQLGDITRQRLAAVGQSDALTSQLAGLAGQQLGAAGQAAGLTGQALDVARASGMIPSMYTDIAGQFGGLGESAFGRRRTELEALRGVGEERRTLDQQRAMAEMAAFREADPFGFAQQFLGTVYGAPTRQTQYSQDPSTFQEIMGIGTLAAPFFKEGGGILSKIKSFYNKARGGTDVFSAEEEAEIRDIENFSDENFGTDYASERKTRRGGVTPAEAMAAVEPRRINADDSAMFAKQAAARQALAMRAPGGGISDYEKRRQERRKRREEDGSSILNFLRENILGPKLLNPGDKKTQDSKNKKQTKQNPAPAPAPAPALRMEPPMPRPAFSPMPDATPSSTSSSTPQGTGQQNKDSILDRILSGVGSGLQSIGSGIRTGAEYYAQNLDPFGPAGANLSREERIRVGLGILAAQPTLGESPLTTTSRGALAAISDLPEEDTDTFTARTSPVSTAEYEGVDRGILTLKGVDTKAAAAERLKMRRDSEKEVLAMVYSDPPLVNNDPLSIRSKILDIYEAKVQKRFGKKENDPVDPAGSDDTPSANQSKIKSKGSATNALNPARIKQITSSQSS